MIIQYNDDADAVDDENYRIYSIELILTNRTGSSIFIYVLSQSGFHCTSTEIKVWLQNTFNAFSEIKEEVGSNKREKQTEENAQHTKSNRILHTKLNNKFHVFSRLSCSMYLTVCVRVFNVCQLKTRILSIAIRWRRCIYTKRWPARLLWRPLMAAL